MHYHLFRPAQGAITRVEIAGFPYYIREHDISATVLIPVDELEEVGFETFYREVPRMATVGLENQINQVMAQVRAPVAWEHFLFTVRQPIHALWTPLMLSGTDAEFILAPVLPGFEPPPETLVNCVGFLFSMVLGVGISPALPDNADDTFYGTFPFFSRSLPEDLGFVPGVEMMLNQEGRNRLGEALSECFSIGLPPALEVFVHA